MATLRKRVNSTGKASWFAEVRQKGYPAQRASFKRKTDANKWIQDTESAIREGRHFKTAEAKKHTFNDMTSRYIRDVLPTKPKQQAKQTQQLTWWCDQIGDYLLSDITPALLVECRDRLLNSTTCRGTKTSNATVVRYMAALSHCFTTAVNEWGWIEDSPMRKVKKPTESRGVVRFLSDDERTRLLKACKQSHSTILYTVVILALSSGMRKSEIMSLKWSDVFLNDGYLILHETKNGERRRVPLSGLALDLLKDHSKVRRIDSQLLFSGRNPNKPIEIKRPWLKAVAIAQIDDFRFHDLRHSAASYMAMNGFSLTVIGELLGHKTVQMTKRYSHLCDSTLSDAVEQMNARIFGDAP